MNCHAPFAGDGVPLSVSNPQSVLLVAVEAELERLRAEVAEAHRLLTVHAVPCKALDGSTMRLADRVAFGLMRDATPARKPEPMPPPPFPDDDPMLPVFPPGPPLLSPNAMRGILWGTLCSIAIYWAASVLWRAFR